MRCVGMEARDRLPNQDQLTGRLYGANWHVGYHGSIAPDVLDAVVGCELTTDGYETM